VLKGKGGRAVATVCDRDDNAMMFARRSQAAATTTAIEQIDEPARLALSNAAFIAAVDTLVHAHFEFLNVSPIHVEI
jgi:hypothetical protein